LLRSNNQITTCYLLKKEQSKMHTRHLLNIILDRNNLSRGCRGGSLGIIICMPTVGGYLFGMSIGKIPVHEEVLPVSIVKRDNVKDSSK
jgi:hypothetical protein